MNSSSTLPRTPARNALAAHFLVGPTGIGKSRVAHVLAREQRRPVVSADSMLVYRGMNVGTAKPSDRALREVSYWGLNLVTPREPFSTGRYLREVRASVPAILAQGGQPIVVGGTGLYIKCLTQGLAGMPEADEELRREAEGLLREQGIEALQRRARETDASGYDQLQDPRNPRRLIRLLERASHGLAAPKGHADTPAPPLVGLRMDMAVLYERIESRARAMFASGLVTEVRELRATYREMSATARQAIGYREAGLLLDGKLSEEEAIARTAARTRQLAKRQMTWFRNQGRVHWVDVTPQMPTQEVARRVDHLWSIHGSAPVRI